MKDIRKQPQVNPGKSAITVRANDLRKAPTRDK